MRSGFPTSSGRKAGGRARTVASAASGSVRLRTALSVSRRPVSWTLSTYDADPTPPRTVPRTPSSRRGGPCRRFSNAAISRPGCTASRSTPCSRRGVAARRKRAATNRSRTTSSSSSIAATGEAGGDLEIEAAIAALPPGARHVLVLAGVYGYSHEETASMLGIAVGTCKAQLHRARQLLSTRLGLGEARHDVRGRIGRRRLDRHWQGCRARSDLPRDLWPAIAAELEPRRAQRRSLALAAAARRCSSLPRRSSRRCRLRRNARPLRSCARRRRRTSDERARRTLRPGPRARPGVRGSTQQLARCSPSASAACRDRHGRKSRTTWPRCGAPPTRSTARLRLQPGDPLLEELLLTTYQEELAVLASVNQLANLNGPRCPKDKGINL